MLEGVPFAAKDLLETAGLETSYGSLIFAGRVASRTAAAGTNVGPLVTLYLLERELETRRRSR